MDDTERITLQLQTTPPACLDGFGATPADPPFEWDDRIRSVWQLACACGSEQGQLLGYGPHGTAGSLISPIGFGCSACGKVTEIIDTARHGYHADVAKREGSTGSAKYRGEGARTAWHCPQCSGQALRVTVAFIFWEAALDLAEDEPDWPLQGFFNVFLLFARCADCGLLSEPTDFGKL